MPTTNYTIPTIGTSGDHVHGWCMEAVAEGDAWLRSQYPSMDWEKALRALSGPGSQSDPLAGASQLSYKRSKRTAREMVASLSQFRHYGETKPCWDQALFDIAYTLNGLDESWYRQPTQHDEHRRGIQYAVALGTGYWWQTWDKYAHGRSRGDIRMTALSPQDVTFIQLPKDGDIQRAYGVLVREELPINLAKAIYGPQNRGFADNLVPDRMEPGWLAKGLQKVQQFLSPALRAAGRMTQEQQGSFPTVDIWHLYTMDGSINQGPLPIEMGPKGTNWSYTVPALGDPLPTGIMNPATGEEFTSAAQEDDCLLFPLRRLTIFSRTGVCYDGTSPYWHGQAPIARLRFSDWAWEALGSSQIADILPLEEGIVALMRLIEDNHAARLDPPLLFDDTLVSSTWAQALSGKKAGARAAAPLMQGEPVKPLLPPDYYHVDAGIYNWIEMLENRMDYLSGVRDMVAIAKAQQIAGADALEKLLEMAGPIVQELVRAVETPLTVLGQQRISLFFQFYTKARVITATGADPLDKEHYGKLFDSQFVPEKLVKLVPGEDPVTRTKRARGLIEQFTYQVSQSGINEINRMSQRLLYMQALKIGQPVSWWSMAKILGQPNFGPEPEGTNTELERWIAQKRIEMDLQIDLAKMTQEATAAMGMGGGPEGAGVPANSQGAAQTPSGQSGPGRPAGFEKAPHLVQKDGGTRSTIATS